MRQKDIDDFVCVLDDVIKQMGEDGGYDAAVKVLEAARRDPRAETAIQFKVGAAIAEMVAQVEGCRVDEILKLDRLPTRRELEQQLVHAPELTNEDLAMIDRLKNMPVRLRRSAEEAAKVIVPKGGHPVLVPRSEYSRICDEISRAVRSGLKLGEAKRRVATMRGCSLSLIEVVWRNRADRGTSRPTKSS